MRVEQLEMKTGKGNRGTKKEVKIIDRFHFVEAMIKLRTNEMER